MARKVTKPLTPQQRRRRTIIIVVSVVGGLLLLAGIVALVFWIRATGQAPLPDDVQEGIEASSDRQRLAPRQQIQQVQNAIQDDRQERFEIRLTNSDIRQMLGRAGSVPGVRSPNVYCGDGRVVVTGSAEYAGRSWNLQAAIQLQASEGGLSGSVTSLKIGSMDAPEELRQQLQSRLQEAMAQQKPGRTGLYIQSISIHPGYAVISGYTTGR